MIYLFSIIELEFFVPDAEAQIIYDSGLASKKNTPQYLL